jgi:hypothetical protein
VRALLSRTAGRFDAHAPARRRVTGSSRPRHAESVRVPEVGRLDPNRVEPLCP